MSGLLSIFVDSDAFTALARVDDTNHAKAQKYLEFLIGQSARFTTSNYVIAEATTVISMRVGHAAAIQFLDQLHATPDALTIYWATEVLHDQAVAIFKEQTSKNVSFVDCVNIAVTRQHRIDAVFSFDSVYRKNGLKLVEEII